MILDSIQYTILHYSTDLPSACTSLYIFLYVLQENLFPLSTFVQFDSCARFSTDILTVSYDITVTRGFKGGSCDFTDPRQLAQMREISYRSPTYSKWSFKRTLFPHYIQSPTRAEEEPSRLRGTCET